MRHHLLTKCFKNRSVINESIDHAIENAIVFHTYIVLFELVLKRRLSYPPFFNSKVSSEKFLRKTQTSSGLMNFNY